MLLRSLLVAGLLLLPDCAAPAATVHDVREYDAKGDDKTKDTAAGRGAVPLLTDGRPADRDRTSWRPALIVLPAARPPR